MPAVSITGCVLVVRSSCSFGPSRIRRATSSPSRLRTDTVHVLVHEKDGRQVGVVVDRILDTIEERIANLRRASGSQVAGSVVVDGHVTQILDLDTLCAGVIAAPVPARAFAERMG